MVMIKNNTLRIWGLSVMCVVCVGVLGGCSSKRIEPMIYPNDYSHRVGEAQISRDIDECNALADQYAKDRDALTEAAKQGLGGAVIGSTAGALGGVIIGGNVGRSVGAGAAVGAVIPLLQMIISSATEPATTPSRETFVNYCMRDRGYQIP
jgi:outer membrane murein-binding lipoprotein Lpp